MSNRKSFIIHIDSLDILDGLTIEQRGELFTAIKLYQKGEEIDLSPIVKIAFSPFKNQFKRDGIKYENLCEKNRLIAIKRHSTKSTTGTSGNQSKRTVTKSTDNKSDNDSKSKNDSDSKTKRFNPPSLIDIKAKILEKGYNVNAEQFFNHYESNGWMVGKSKMKKWHSALSNWHSRNNKNTPEQNTNQLPTWELGSQ